MPSPLARAAVLLTMAAAAAACSATATPGIELDLSVESPSRSGGGPGEIVINNDRGYRIVVTRGYLVTRSVDLLACPGTSASRRAPSFSLVGTAFAHDAASPTHVGAPLVESLLAPDRSRTWMGTFRPAPDRYCQVRVVLGPADADARGLPSDANLIGKSLLLAGRYQLAGSDATLPFALSSDRVVEINLSVGPLLLDEAAPRRQVVVLKKASDHWFDGIDMESRSDADVGRRILENVRASLEAAAF